MIGLQVWSNFNLPTLLAIHLLDFQDPTLAAKTICPTMLIF